MLLRGDVMATAEKYLYPTKHSCKQTAHNSKARKVYAKKPFSFKNKIDVKETDTLNFIPNAVNKV